MTIQASDIIQSVRQRLRQKTEAESNWDDSDILIYLSDAIEEVCRDTECFRTWVKYVANGTSKFPLPSNLIKPIGEPTSTQGPVPWLTATDINPGNELPLDLLLIAPNFGAKILGEFIYFLPAPTDPRYLHYYGWPDIPITDPSDSIPLPRTVRMPLIYSTCFHMASEVGKADRAPTFWTLYQDALVKAASAAAATQKAGPNQVRRPKMRGR